jgi:hypothetical protein
MTGIDEFDEMGALGPAVRADVCGEYRADPACPWCTCEACGWLEADHHGGGVDAVIIPLVDRRAEPVAALAQAS